MSWVQLRENGKQIKGAAFMFLSCFLEVFHNKLSLSILVLDCPEKEDEYRVRRVKVKVGGLLKTGG